jgi:hypothetical protein
MDERYKLAILRLPENAYFLWVTYLSESYRREHVIFTQIDDNPEELLSITLFHTHPAGVLNTNKKKLAKTRRDHNRLIHIQQPRFIRQVRRLVSTIRIQN